MTLRIFCPKYFFVLVFFAILFVLSSCQYDRACPDQIGCLTLAKGESLIIGVEHATTGDESNLSQSIIDIIKNSVQQQPLWNGYPIELFIQDTPCTAPDQIATTG